MNNPYKVLGVNERATDDEIKQAYRELARKYHPDRYRDNPLADLASEKMKEINEAYDSITKQRKQGGSANNGEWANAQNQASSQGQYSGGSNGEFVRIRSLIEAGNLKEAEFLLRNITNHNAEWYFLNGLVAMRRGWYNEAYKFFSTANNMEPNNFEYRNAFAQMQNQGNQYRNFGGQQSGCSACDMCSGLICADCCCECAGGDLIGCC